MAVDPQKEVMQQCCLYFSLDNNSTLSLNEGKIEVETYLGEDLFDPFFFELAIASQNVLGDDYTIIEGLESISPDHIGLGKFEVDLGMVLLPRTIGEYVALWSIKATEESNMLGYERIFTIVGI